MSLSYLAENIPSSPILAIHTSIKKRMQAGEALYNFTVGDFDPAIFPIPIELEDEIVNAYRNAFTNYPAAEGNEDLRQSISAFVKQFYKLDYSPASFIVASGGRPLIYAAYQTIVDPGDKVIYGVPSWNNQFYAEFVQAKKILIEATPENNFIPDAAQIESHLKDAVLLVLCSPQNPSGTCISAENLHRICTAVVVENDRRPANAKKLYLLFDQLYALLVYEKKTHYDPVSVYPPVRPYTIYIDGISKGFAATGVRVGWCFGPEPVLEKMKALLTHIGAWAPMAEQKALAAYLVNTPAIRAYLDCFKHQLSLRLNLIYEGFMQLKEEGFAVDIIPPRAAIYLAVKIELPGDGLLFLLNQAGLGILPFSAFGVQGNSSWYRLSVGTCKVADINPMLIKLKQALCHTTTV